MSIHQLSVPGARLYCEAFGNIANPALVFIHAGVADRTMWDPQIAPFVDTHFIVRYDTRGFGKTETTNVAFSNRDDVIAVLDHFGLRSAVLIGCSRAGAISLDTAIEFPDRVRALVWVCGGISGMSYEDDPNDRRHAAAELLFAEADAAESQRNWQRLAELDVQIWADGLAQPIGRCHADVRKKVQVMCLSNYQADWPAGSAIQLDPPAAGRLELMHAPTLIVLGDLDTRSTELSAMVLAERLPRNTFVTMAGTAHLPSMELPDVFNAHLRLFLDSI
jgi:3-oxoadipate enol-lactonase